MTTLEILERSFRSIEPPTSSPRCLARADIYLLIDSDEVVYVGSSHDVDRRLYAHVVTQRSRADAKRFDRALWLALPVAVHPHYEGAFVRALCPIGNRTCPAHQGHDSEILDGFGIAHLENDRWATIAAARRGQPLRAGHVGSRIRDARSRVGISQTSLALSIGVCKQAIAHWELGVSDPSDENLKAAAAALGVSAAELWSGSPATGAA